MTLSAINPDASPHEPFAIENEQLIEMTNELLVAMLGLEVSSVSEVSDDLAGVDSSAWQASVCIEGDWSAIVQTIATEKLATRIACTMFSMEPADLSTEELSDAMGEVANIVGGNVKGVVGLESSLKLPCVGKFTKEDQTTPNRSLAFDCGGEHLTVLVTAR